MFLKFPEGLSVMLDTEKRSLLTHYPHVLDQMADQQRMHAPAIGSGPWAMSGTYICFRGQENGGSYL